MATRIFEKWDDLVKENLTEDERNKIYNELSATYEQEAENLNMSIHSRFAERVTRLFPERAESVNILDVGAGTGLLGKEFLKRGFKNIDGLDPAQEMLKVAQAHGVYRKAFVGDLEGYTAIPGTAEKYDAIVSLGVLLPNHLQPEHLRKAFELLKQGGYLAFLTRSVVLTPQDAYGKEVIQCLQRLQISGTARKVAWEPFENYHGDMGTTGINILYEKLK